MHDVACGLYLMSDRSSSSSSGGGGGGGNRISYSSRADLKSLGRAL